MIFFNEYFMNIHNGAGCQGIQCCSNAAPCGKKNYSDQQAEQALGKIVNYKPEEYKISVVNVLAG